MDVKTFPVARVLVVADWAVDPYGVIAACHRRAAEGGTVFALVVPARLHGLDWVGDPYASRPCAARQLEALERIATAGSLVRRVRRASGLTVRDVAIAAPSVTRERRGWSVLRGGGHCPADAPQAA
jgi:hypothetical protein